MGHAQSSTPVITDNTTANGIFNHAVKQRRTKAMDMRFNWIIDRQAQNNVSVQWKPGSFNQVDYFTKHHSAVHHIRVRPTYAT